MMMQQLAFDPFLYSDGALATVSGGAWMDRPGYPGVQVVEQRAANPDVVSDAYAVLSTWAGHPADHYAQHILGVWATGLLLRGDGSDTFIEIKFVPLDAIYVHEVVNNVATLLDTPIALGEPLLAGDVLSAEIQGVTILAKQNGTIVGTRTATGAIASGKPGFYLDRTAACDDWTAGDFQAPSPELIVGLV